eukprot:TRINITY_DN1813_c1_g2_i1.p1 TRINITY_DN1813_c1_g2~~TRINITY_DN1813_c1_g2_i1.p1  ORF type:complete len:270 (-),score=42.54 TRINITY_DN1813_c1_g2_i1:124-912(-)
MGIFEDIIAPVIGTILANVMFFSPLTAVLQVRQTQTLGELNPLPFPVITANCVGWLLYAVLLKNYFLLFGNLPGALLGIFYSLTCLTYAPQKIRDLMTTTMIIFPLIFTVYMFALAKMQASEDTTQFAIGIVNNVILVIYYAAPLSVFYKVIHSRDSSSLYFPLVVANTVNGAMWFVYGLLGLGDPFVWVGNGIGTILNVVSIILIFVYPNREKEQSLSQNKFLRWTSSKSSMKTLDVTHSTIEISDVVNISASEDKSEDFK